jgi:hypothetical protein
LLPDGKRHVKTESEWDGKWPPGRDMTYEEAPDAEVRYFGLLFPADLGIGISVWMVESGCRPRIGIKSTG